MKEISNKEIFVGDIGDSCKNIMKTGRWLTWEQNGFERAISVDGHEIDVQDPKDERYSALGTTKFRGLRKYSILG